MSHNSDCAHSFRILEVVLSGEKSASRGCICLSDFGLLERVAGGGQPHTCAERGWLHVENCTIELSCMSLPLMEKFISLCERHNGKMWLFFFWSVVHPLTQGYKKLFACISISYKILSVSSVCHTLCAGFSFP